MSLRLAGSNLPMPGTPVAPSGKIDPASHTAPSPAAIASMTIWTFWSVSAPVAGSTAYSVVAISLLLPTSHTAAPSASTSKNERPRPP